MEKFSFLFILLHLSVLLLSALFIYILKKINKKSQMIYVFLGFIGSSLIWAIGSLLELYSIIIFKKILSCFVYISLTGLCFVPVSLLLTGIIFAYTKIKFSRMYLLLFAFPLLDFFIIITNERHKLFLKIYSPMNDQIVYGSFFIIHTIFSYLYLAIGLYYLLYFSIKNAGFFSKQSMLIFIGSLIPFIMNMLFTLKLVIISQYATPVAFSFGVICFAFAILKFDFLNVMPIALQRIVDLISDGFVVLDREQYIIDFNKSFADAFGKIVKFKRKDKLMDFLKQIELPDADIEKFIRFIDIAKAGKKSVNFERHIRKGSFDKYFEIEITPVISQQDSLGTIILLKDITQHKKNLAELKEKQAILMEQERLASLGQLIGGIAHNLKTPIMSIAGGIEALKDLAREYDASIDDENVTKGDHHEIAAEMAAWLDKMKPYCSYMSDIISTVKGQAVQLNASAIISFTLDELVKRVDLLMKHELKKFHCNLNMEFDVDMNTEIKGDVSSLVQIFDNLIINAIHAYEGKSGDIDFIIKKDDNNIVFMLRDYGKGIRRDIKDRLFKEMVTTKGKDGTGLGLYMSYANIKGRFGGNMWFESQEGKGTTFYISIPYVKGYVYQGAY